MLTVGFLAIGFGFGGQIPLQETIWGSYFVAHTIAGNGGPQRGFNYSPFDVGFVFNLMLNLFGFVITSYSIHYTKLYDPDA